MVISDPLVSMETKVPKKGRDVCWLEASIVNCVGFEGVKLGVLCFVDSKGVIHIPKPSQSWGDWGRCLRFWFQNPS